MSHRPVGAVLVMAGDVVDAERRCFVVACRWLSALVLLFNVRNARAEYCIMSGANLFL